MNTPRRELHQRGSVLIVALMLLLVLTVLGVTAMNNMTMEERMAAAYQKMDQAFQGGLTALNIAVQRGTFATTINGACGNNASEVVALDTNSLVQGTTTGASVKSTFLGGWQNARALRGYELGVGGGSPFEAGMFDLEATVSVVAAGAEVAQSVQVQTIQRILPSGASGCQYVPPGPPL